MDGFVKRVSKKLSKLTSEQVEQLIEEISQEKEMQDSILESLSTGLIVCDNAGIVMQSNRAAEGLLPFSRPLSDPWVSETPLWENIADEDAAAFVRSLWVTQKVASREFPLEIAGDSFRHVSISAVPLVQGKKIAGLIIKIDDITERFNQQLLIRRMENLSSLTNLAANVAHEIKNPLGSISIHIQLMQKALAKARQSRTLPAEQYAEHYLEVINEEIDRLNKIIVDFLLAVRPVKPEFALKDPDALVARYAEFLEPELRSKGITLSLFLEAKVDDLPARVLVDEKLFNQALLNLAQNAIAAMPDGGELTLASKVKNDRYTLTVTDTGAGMDDRTLSRIFEPYFTTKADGTGLGLTMVYKIIREFFGDIAVVSEPGEGTAFIITLPLRLSRQKLLADQSL
ncbi:MAG: PAS domain-containing protein [Spirochaetaceae bacterium]|jgi:signal transduction histidine kinase|nr:PAS domain-containing protein [Spirochaetaceae bacterium]